MIIYWYIIIHVCMSVTRWGVNKLQEALDGPVEDGLRAVLIFGVPQKVAKVS